MSGARLEVPFAKWHGAGNDYLFVELDGLDATTAERLRERAPAIARRVSARRTGVGSDGLVLLERDDAVDLRLVMHNADGSRGRVCGTALRCVAAGLVTGEFAGGARRGARELVLASDAGRHAAVVEAVDGGLRPRVALGRPVFDAERIPLAPVAARVLVEGGAEPWQVRLATDGAEWEGLVLSVGNPHFVVPLEGDPAALDVAHVAPPLESHAAFPERANVSFVHLRADGALEQRTFERGSGETASCGSGASAAVVALCHLGALARDRAHAVHMPGGVLDVTYASDGVAWLGGPTERVCRGVFDIALD